jgi:phosphopantothenoylcysteine synthetase/decarboxylase
MNILITAGNTLVPIDRVRCLTNVFTGKTGAQLALQAHARGHQVLLLTSHPEALRELSDPVPELPVRRYRLFEELRQEMETALARGTIDAVIHCAAVSDYAAAGVFAPAPHTRFRADHHWESDVPELPALVDRSAAKVKSDEPELWLRLVRTPKLVDQLREPWGFRGVLVKFKLEVGVTEEQLLDVAERSRLHSRADLMVANTLEGAAAWAYLGPVQGGYQRLARRELADRLLEEVERLHG